MEPSTPAQTASKRKLKKEPALKQKGTDIVLHAASMIMARAGIGAGDIVGGTKVANVLQKSISFLNPSNNEKIAQLMSLYDEEHTVGGITKKLTDWTAFVEKVALIHDCPMTPDSDWVAAVLPTLTYSSCFEDRLKELRLGHSEFVWENSRRKETKEEIASYGLKPGHAVLLSGIQTSRLKGPAAAKSLGPLTQMIRLNLKKITAGKKTWSSVLHSTLAHIPFKVPLIKVLQRGRFNFQEVCPIIGDILLLTGSREDHELALPLGALTGYMSAQFTATMANEYLVVDQWDGTTEKPTTDFRSRRICTTGKKGVLTYNAFMSGVNIIWPARGGKPELKKPRTSAAELAREETRFDASTSGSKNDKTPTLQASGQCPTFYDIKGAAQIIFMCVFDSYKEDLGLQAWMCDETTPWLRADELVDLKELTGEESIKRVEDPKIVKKYSKPYSPDPVAQYPRKGSMEPFAAVGSFGGHRVNVDKMNAYFECDEQLDNMLVMLREFLNQLGDRTNGKNLSMKWGHNDWHPVSADWVDTDITLEPYAANEQVLFHSPRNVPSCP